VVNQTFLWLAVLLAAKYDPAGWVANQTSWHPPLSGSGNMTLLVG